MNVKERNQLRNISLFFENIKNEFIKNKYLEEKIIINLGVILSYDEILLLTKYSCDDYILHEYFYYLNNEKELKNLPHYWIDFINLQFIIIRYKQ